MNSSDRTGVYISAIVAACVVALFVMIAVIVAINASSNTAETNATEAAMNSACKDHGGILNIRESKWGDNYFMTCGDKQMKVITTEDG